MIQVSNQAPLESWQDFLEKEPEASIYHTPEWKECLERTFRYSPKYIFASDENGVLTGILPLFLIDGKIFGKRLVSLPFSHICGPIGTSESVDLLIQEAKSIAENMGKIPLTINSPVDYPNFGYTTNYSTYVLDLSNDANVLWKSFDRGSVRWAINRAKKEEVTVRESRDHVDLKDFFYLNTLTKKDLGVPCHPLSFFTNISTILPDKYRLYLAERDHEIIGGGLMLRYKDKVIYGYGAAKPSELKYHPYNAFIWQSIQDACAEGNKSYDFGRCSHSDTGLMDFKRRWGTRELSLTYSNYPLQSQSGPNRSGAIVNFGSKILRLLPLRIYSAMSERIFGELG
jgi:hypothetical protein